MTSENLYKLLNTYLRADGRGRTLSEDEFNRLATMVNDEVFSFVARDPEEDQEIADNINYLKVIGASVTLDTSAKGTLPSGYGRLLGEPYIVASGEITTIDVVTFLERIDREMDVLTKPSATYPVAVFGGGDSSVPEKYFTVYPTTFFASTNVYLDYIKKPNAPFIDYYINDTTYVVTYMAEGATSVSIPSGSTYRDGTAGPVSKDSQTVDPLWEGSLLTMFINMFLQKMGIQVGDYNLTQYGMAQQNKQEVDE